MLDFISDIKDRNEKVENYNKSSKYRIVKDRPLKSVLKAITWRIVGTADTILISYILTGKAVIAFSIGSIEVFSKMLLYFVHERIWEQLRWGRMLVYIRRNRRNAKKRIYKLVFRTV